VTVRSTNPSRSRLAQGQRKHTLRYAGKSSRLRSFEPSWAEFKQDNERGTPPFVAHAAQNVSHPIAVIRENGNVPFSITILCPRLSANVPSWQIEGIYLHYGNHSIPRYL